MSSADQVPVKSPHSIMHWHVLVVLIAGSTGTALRAVRPPNLHVTPDGGVISFTRLMRRVPCSVHPWPSWPMPFLRSCWRARSQRPWSAVALTCRKPGPMFGAMDLGIADDSERASGEQIAIALFADTAELVLAPARVLLWYKADPGRKIPSASEGLWISDTGDQSGGERGTNAGNLIQPLARLVGSVPGDNLTVKVENLHL